MTNVGEDADGCLSIDASGVRVFESFPFAPYDIQSAFMRKLYDALDEKRIGLFESPTGTGKTLSLICGALEWLEENRDRQSTNQESDPEGDDPPWIMEQFRKMTCTQQKQQQAIRDRRIEKTRTKIQKASLIQQRHQQMFSFIRNVKEKEEREQTPTSCSATKTKAVYPGEFKRTRFSESLSLVSMASRKALCVYDKVARLTSASHINEACLDLKRQKSTKSTRIADKNEEKPIRSVSSRGGGCPFLKRKDEADHKRHRHVIDVILSQPMDIESLAELGRKKVVCPYYATRAAIEDADVILLPYSSLLSDHTKESLGIELEGNILIVDEAHNLVDAINDTHRAMIDEYSLKKTSEALEIYFRKFELRLAPSNSENVQMLIRIVAALVAYCAGIPSESITPRTCSVNQFLFDCQLDDINFLKIVKWMRKAKLAQKVSNFVATEEENSGGRYIYGLCSFLDALHNDDRHGCLIIERTNAEASVQITFVLLNPAVHFEHILESCHSVILASGTLSPLSLIKSQLFSKRSHLDRLTSFSCSHIVPMENVLAMTITHGPSKQKLNFRYENRTKTDSLSEVSQMLLDLSGVVPEGMIVFVPSFLYLSALMHHLDSQGILQKLNRQKTVFSEPKGIVEMESTFKQYKAACTRDGPKTGALLFCVVGGKLSEGINFGDGLGRCVLMIGLPYPNSQDPELKERIKHISEAKDEVFHANGRHYYEDLCMKAVNQSIGRVIRHANDYACILLADERYSNPSVIKKLPQWIQPSFNGSMDFQGTLSATTQFFKRMDQNRIGSREDSST